MHEAGCFIIPNPWDVGSARALQHLGFKALASTSAGFAWTIGKSDNHITLEEALKHLTELCGAVDLPVNADFEGGFAHEADKVAVNVARAVKTGVAGLSIEDSTGDAEKPLYERELAVARIKAARARDRCRQERRIADRPLRGFLVGRADLDMVIDRLKAYSEAGADCLYAPGIKTREQIAAVVKAVHPKPVNLLIGASGLSVQGGRRSRRSPHQRRRLAGAHRLGRIHARGARDRGEGDLHRTWQGYPGARIEQDVQLTCKTQRRNGIARRACIQIRRSRYLLAGMLLAGGLPVRFTSWPVGAAEAGLRMAGAAPVVTPGALFGARGVTSRMPGGAARRRRLRGILRGCWRGRRSARSATCRPV